MTSTTSPGRTSPARSSAVASTEPGAGAGAGARGPLEFQAPPDAGERGQARGDRLAWDAKDVRGGHDRERVGGVVAAGKGERGLQGSSGEALDDEAAAGPPPSHHAPP